MDCKCSYSERRLVHTASGSLHHETRLGHPSHGPGSVHCQQALLPSAWPRHLNLSSPTQAWLLRPWHQPCSLPHSSRCRSSHAPRPYFTGTTTTGRCAWWVTYLRGKAPQRQWRLA